MSQEHHHEQKCPRWTICVLLPKKKVHILKQSNVPSASTSTKTLNLMEALYSTQINNSEGRHTCFKSLLNCGLDISEHTPATSPLTYNGSPDNGSMRVAPFCSSSEGFKFRKALSFTITPLAARAEFSP